MAILEKSQIKDNSPARASASPIVREEGQTTALSSNLYGAQRVTITDSTGTDMGASMPVELASAISGLISGVQTDTILVAPFKRADAFTATFNSADASTRAQVKAASASKKIYVTGIIISSGAAISVKIQDSTTSAVILLQSIYMAANTTVTMNFSTPLECSTGKDLEVIASGAGNITVNVQGYII